MLKQHDADLEHDRLHEAIMGCPDLARPSAIIGMLLDAITEHTTADAMPGLLAATLFEITTEKEAERLILTPADYQGIISEAYRRIFYDLDKIDEHGLARFRESRNLAEFTDWVIASVKGEAAAHPLSCEGMH